MLKSGGAESRHGAARGSTTLPIDSFDGPKAYSCSGLQSYCRCFICLVVYVLVTRCAPEPSAADQVVVVFVAVRHPQQQQERESSWPPRWRCSVGQLHRIRDAIFPRPCIYFYFNSIAVPLSPASLLRGLEGRLCPHLKLQVQYSTIQNTRTSRAEH